MRRNESADKFHRIDGSIQRLVFNISTTRRWLKKGKKKEETRHPRRFAYHEDHEIYLSIDDTIFRMERIERGGCVGCVWGTCMNPFPRTVFLSFPIVATRHKPPSAPSWDPLCAHPISLIIPIMLWADIPIKGEEPQQATKR